MVPDVTYYKSSPMVHRFGDLFNPPGLTNFIGCVQADIDILGIRSFNFPPYAGADTVTANLFVDGKFFPSTGTSITFTWFPDRIEREAEYNGLVLKTITVLAVEKTAAIQSLEIRNISGYERAVDLKIGLRGYIARTDKPWNTPLPYTEGDNELIVDTGRNAHIYKARHSTAVRIQGASVIPDAINKYGLKYRINLAANGIWNLNLVDAVGANTEEAGVIFDSLIGSVPNQITLARNDWNEELRAVFTPGNSRYSGYLPVLNTQDEDIKKLYYMGMLGVIYFKRDNPFSVYGRAYDTLMPRYWQSVTFLWDYSLSSLVHALLDPEVMRKYLELWMKLDIHKHFGTEYLTGAGVGPWYSVNDFAMSVIANDYLRFTGDHTWVDKKIRSGSGGKDKTVFGYLQSYATNWKRFKTNSGLADYGGLANLLECVSTYVHEVASLNAANVYNMRFASDLYDLKGLKSESESMKTEAADLIGTIQKLYVPGKGYWGASFPDGSLAEVRHCYDLLTILNTIGRDLPRKQVDEITEFFVRELRTPVWMHAISCDDDDVMFSVRPDHQWNGAYPAWPPQTALGLYRVGKTDIAFRWLKGLAKSANQGPFGQAHFVETIIEPENGGARKAPPDLPFITDWTCSSNGSWNATIIEGIFGVRATIANGITASPRFGDFDPGAELLNLQYQGRNYNVIKHGIHEA
jgi:hypothetical protein